MIDGFVACTACACLVKAEDASCPFCGAKTSAASRPSARAFPQRRKTRSAWLSVGPASLVGAVATSATCAVVTAACNGATVADKFVVEPEASAPSSSVDTSVLPADAAIADAGADAARAFACGDRTCVWPATYCLNDRVEQVPCGSNPGHTVSSTFSCVAWEVPAQCGQPPTCETCTDAGVGWSTGGTCSDDGWLVTHYLTNNGCGCYGCPPARFERLIA